MQIRDPGLFEYIWKQRRYTPLELYGIVTNQSNPEINKLVTQHLPHQLTLVVFDFKSMRGESRKSEDFISQLINDMTIFTNIWLQIKHYKALGLDVSSSEPLIEHLKSMASTELELYNRRNVA